MGKLSGNNKFNTSYKKRPFDSYKSIVDKLDEETKKKLDRQRTLGMLVIVMIVLGLIIVLAVTGIGVDKSRSVMGNVFADKEKVLIECFGDSITEGWTLKKGYSVYAETTYPQEMQSELLRLFSEDGRKYKFTTLEVKNYGMSTTVLSSDSASRLSGNADIVVMLYIVNNFSEGTEYEGMIESNIEMIRNSGSQVFLMNYPCTTSGRILEGYAEQANNTIAYAADKLSVKLFDANAYFKELETQYSEDDLFIYDGLHLTDLGYKLLGDFAAQQIHDYYFENYQ